MPKQSFRERFLAQRKSLPEEQRESLSCAIQQKFVASQLFARAGCLALYSAIHNEVMTDTVASHALQQGKQLAYPRTRGKSLEFVAISSLTELAPGAFGVLEPAIGDAISWAALELIVVPGVAFDRAGHRLGYGRGYYDRALAFCGKSCERVGFAYDFQLVPALPLIEEHDRTVSMLMTEKETINFT
jgi:5-formyltetrahydrofolate cyclo-ligase